MYELTTKLPVSMRTVTGSSADPVYNIKAAAAATGLPQATLRAWERRYGVVAPDRTPGGYRLYSESDIALLRWLKARTGEGMTISKALALRHSQETEPRAREPEAEVSATSRLDLSALRLATALSNFDESSADQVLAETFAAYGIEIASERVIAPVVRQIGEHRHDGKASAAAEHFASNYLCRKLELLISAGRHHEGGELIVLGCAPNDWHELELLTINLLLQRRGYDVIYLGQNVPVAQFTDEMRRLAPALVIISATTENSIAGVRAMADAVQAMDAPRPMFGFGGSVFNGNPGLQSQIPGLFMGENAHEALINVGAVLDERRREARRT